MGAAESSRRLAGQVTPTVTADPDRSRQVDLFDPPVPKQPSQGCVDGDGSEPPIRLRWPFENAAADRVPGAPNGELVAVQVRPVADRG